MSNRDPIRIRTICIETGKSKVHSSIRAAGRYLKISHKNIRRCLYGIQMQVKGHLVEYVDERDKKHNRRIQSQANAVISKRAVRSRLRTGARDAIDDQLSVPEYIPDRKSIEQLVKECE